MKSARITSADSIRSGRMGRHDMDVLALVQDEEVRLELQGMSGALNGHRFTLRPRPESLSAAPGADAVILDVGGPAGRLDEPIRRIADRQPLILVGAGLTAHDVRRYMQLGVVDVLPLPVAPRDLLDALDRAAAMLGGSLPADAGRLVCVLKAGGGVGASMLAVQAGRLLAARGASEGWEACLIDLDLQFGSGALYLDVEPKTGLADLVDARDRVDGAFLRSAALRHGSGLHLLAPPATVMPLDAMEPALAASILDLARTEFRHVLVDMPQSWTAWSYAALMKADLIVLTTSLTVACVHQTRRQLDTLEAHGIDLRRVRLVLNRFQGGDSDRALLRDAEQALGRSFDTIIRRDDQTVQAALDKGIALAEAKRGSPVERDLRGLVDAVFDTGQTKRTAGWFTWPFGQRRS